MKLEELGQGQSTWFYSRINSFSKLNKQTEIGKLRKMENDLNHSINRQINHLMRNKDGTGRSRDCRIRQIGGKVTKYQ